MAPIVNRTPRKQRQKEYHLIESTDETMQRNGEIKTSRCRSSLHVKQCVVYRNVLYNDINSTLDPDSR